MEHTPESEQPRRKRRRWYHPRKTDAAFVAGLVVFVFNGVRGGPVDPTIVYASVALMGFSAAGRVDHWLQDNDPDDDEGPHR